jgi:hypothetical protein
MDWLANLVAEMQQKKFKFELNEPADKTKIKRSYPVDLRKFLGQHDGAVLFHGENPEWSGVHLLGTARIAEVTDRFVDIYGHAMKGLVVCGYTPGAGAYYLAMNKLGQIIDIYGSPTRTHRIASRFVYYRGEWKVIADSITSLVTAMFANPDEPCYWF